MLLAEAIIEKEYMRDSISELLQRIERLSKTDKAGNLLEKAFNKLDKLYDKYQQLSVSIDRSEANTIIKVNKSEVRLRDAIIIKKVMRDRISNFERILNGSNTLDNIVYVDYNKINEKIDELMSDIKVLDSKIQYARWNTEAA